MPRVKLKKEVEAADKMKYDKDDFRFATPKIVADYRAKRLKCNVLCEIGAGVGFQTIAFSKTCKKVYAVEIDKRKAKFLKENMKKLGIKNVEVICGDGLSKEVIDKVSNSDVVFVDTERAASEDVRKISSVKPNVNELISVYENICIEVPPQIRDIALDCEKEYVSVNKELNRLNLYFGTLKKYSVNVVSLPSGKRLIDKGNEIKEVKKFNHNFLYDIDSTVVRAGLLNELPGTLFRADKPYIISNKKLKSEFLTEYKVLKISEDVKQDLKALKCGEVVLKYKVNPKDYWKQRKKYEKDLKGKKRCYLFKFGKFVICSKTKVK